MKNFLVVILLVVLMPIRGNVFALTPSNSPLPATFQEKLRFMREQREEIIENRQQKRDDLGKRRDELNQKRGEINEKVATRQAQVRQKVVANISKLFGKILNRLNRALSRLDKIADRIASRIDKLKEKGVDTSAAETQLAQAEELGASAKLKIEDAQGAISAIDPQSATVRDAVHTARDAVSGAKDALKAYHKALVEALRELKASAELREGTSSAN